MNREDITRDNQTLIAFWDRAFAASERPEEAPEPEDLRDLAPSDKLYRAACSLGGREKVLDYGCGSGWAAVIAAKGGCADVTAADAAPAALRAARLCAARHGVEDRIRFDLAGPGWLRSVPDGTYDGLFCSNVLDVVPPETAEEIIRAFARIVRPGGTAVIGLNYFLSPEAAAARGLTLEDGCRLYVDGVLRLVSGTDGEWTRLFSPGFTQERLDHFAWPGEEKESRRLFMLRRREG